MLVGKRILISIAIISASVFVGSMLFDVSKQSDKEIYATSLTVDGCPREIELVLGNYIVFDKEPYTLTPSNCNQVVEVDIVDHLSKPVSTASYDNLVFKADAVASYYLRFKAMNKNGNYYKDILKIKVVDKLDATTGWVNTVDSSISTVTGSPVDLSKMISIVNSEKSPTFYLNGERMPANFTSTKVGNHKLYAGLKEENYMKCVDLSVYVSPQSPYDIKVFDIFGTEIPANSLVEVELTSKYYVCTFEIPGGESQEVTVVSSNTKCIFVESYDAPLINLKLLTNGESELTISYKTKSVTIVVRVV